MNDHLPTITRTGVRQLVNQGSRSTSGGGGRSNNNAGYSNNPDWVGVPTQISATHNRFTNSGRPAYSDEYPFGLPPSLSADSNMTGYQKQPQASGLSDRHVLNIVSSNPPMPDTPGGPFEGMATEVNGSGEGRHTGITRSTWDRYS